MWSRGRLYTQLGTQRDQEAKTEARSKAKVRLAQAPVQTQAQTQAQAQPVNPLPPPPPPPSGIPECTAVCSVADALALPILQEVAATVPVPSTYTGALPPTTCVDACTLLAASDLASVVAAPAMPLCNQETAAAAAMPGHLLNSTVLAQQAQAAVQAGLGSTAANAIQAVTAGVMTPSQALAADALVGTLRVRDEADGWQRVGTGQPCLTFPQDHGLHRNMADEWYFVVGVLTARGEGETTDTSIAFCWMLDWRLVAPTVQPDAMAGYIVDAQFAVAEQGAPNNAMHAALWGGATKLTATNNPLRLEAGGMALREIRGAAREGLNSLHVKGVNAASGALLNIVVARNPAVAPLVLELGTGIVGDVADGNGNLYYSAPFLAVQPGGSIVSYNAAGGRTARTVTGGIAWFDHQLGTLGRPTGWGTAALWSILAAASPNMLPIVDRGFGVSGQENWWGLMFTQGPLAGIAFMGTVLALQPASALANATVAGNWILPDGKGGALVIPVSGTVSATASVASSDGSAFASAFAFALPLPQTQAQAQAQAVTGSSTSTLTVTASNLAADGFMQWSKGDTYSEAALVLACSDGSSGVGWAEQVGWDTTSTAKLLGTLGVQPSSTALTTWQRAPSSFAVGGYWFLAGAALLGLIVVVLAGWGITKAVRHHKRKQLQRRAKAPAYVPAPTPMSAPTPMVMPAPVPMPTPMPTLFTPAPMPTSTAQLHGGYAAKPHPTAVDSLVARWLQ